MIDWSFNGSDSVLSFDAIPLWQGVQIRPGVRYEYPFRLGFLGPGPIRQVTDREIINRIVEAYESSDYGFITPPPGASDWANSLGDMYTKWVFDAAGSLKPRRVLEIGAGSLYVAKTIASYFGTDEYVVVDPSIRDRTPQPQLEVLPEYFPCERLGGRSFDLVLALNCLEHVPDPIMFCRAIRDRMAQNAFAILVFPDCEAALARGDLNVLVHEHLTYFTADSIRRLVTNSGLTVNAIDSINDTFVVVLSKSVSDGSFDEIENSNSELQLLQLSASSFRKVLTVRTAEFRSALEAGKKIGFHGATNGLNIFLHLANLGKHPNVNIYDGDGSKAGYFLPACDKPIRVSDDCSYGGNDLLVVSAMSYYDKIARFAIERHGVKPEQLHTLSV